jgi:4-hydroxymandelate oxidase
MAQQVAAHPEAEAATGRGVRAAGSLLGVSTNTAAAFGDVQSSGAPWWYQVYIHRDRSLTERLVTRAVEHGARAMILTVDMVTTLAPDVDPLGWPEGPGKARITNLTATERAAVPPSAITRVQSLGFDDIGWLARISGLPVLVKGVMRADDAAQCADAGAAGVIVSTHGGRRSAVALSSARALPGVVDALAGRGEVYVDSGIRRGEHVAAALAMGARGVFVGRPALWGLAARGEAGVAEVLSGLSAELAQVMMQLGAPRLADLTVDLLA